MPETRTNTVILAFSGSHRFLSNFFIEPDGTHVEREYQAQKCANYDDIGRFAKLTPEEALSLAARNQAGYINKIIEGRSSLCST